MNKKVEEKRIREAHKSYSTKVRQVWKKLIEKYEFDNETALTIIADFWYEPDNAEEFETEWIDGADEIRSEMEKKYGVFIEHEEEMITVRNEYFVYDGYSVIEEDS